MLQGLDAQLSPAWLGRDLVSLRLTSHHLLTGHSSGWVSLYRRRNCGSDLEKKISRRVTGRDNISLVSLAPGLVCVGCRTGEVVLLHLHPVSLVVLRIQESVTALSISRAAEVYVGGDRGCVAVFSSRARDTRQILDLAAPLVQIAVSGDTVVASSTADTVICNSRLKTFRHVGSQQRSGHHGVCLAGGQVWSSRPGARVWRVDIKTGEVLATVKYKPLLRTINSSRIIGSASSTSSTTSSTSEHSFSNLNTDSSGLTVTFSNSGNILYILDLEQSEVIAWSPVNDIQIKEAHLEGDLVLIVGRGGELLSLRVGSVLQLAGHCIAAQREDLLYDLLVSVHQEEEAGGLREFSPLDLSKLYFLCLHLEPAWDLGEMEAEILRVLGTSREVLSRSAPAQTSPLAAREDINTNVRR